MFSLRNCFVLLFLQCGISVNGVKVHDIGVEVNAFAKQIGSNLDSLTVTFVYCLDT